MIKTAVISDDQLYRYALIRLWDDKLPVLAYIMLNPSIADANVDDATIRVCMGRAQKLGYGSITVFNLFAFRSTYPKDLLTAADPIGPENDFYLQKALNCDKIIVAWGNHGSLLNRDMYVKNLLRLKKLWCLGVTKSNQPKHPLRISYDIDLIEY